MFFSLGKKHILAVNINHLSSSPLIRENKMVQKIGRGRTFETMIVHPNFQQPTHHSQTKN